jgi:hypothetical protein
LSVIETISDSDNADYDASNESLISDACGLLTDDDPFENARYMHSDSDEAKILYDLMKNHTPIKSFKGEREGVFTDWQIELYQTPDVEFVYVSFTYLIQGESYFLFI